MKRILATLLAVILLFGAFACKKDPAQTEKAPEAEIKETEVPTPAPTEAPTPTPVPTPEPTKSPADFWTELSDQYPALRAATSKRTLRLHVYDPSACGIDTSELPPIGPGSLEEMTAYYDYLQALLDRVHAIGRESLDEKDQFAYDTVVASLETKLAEKEFPLYVEPLAPSAGVHCDLPDLFATHRIESVDDIEAYLEEAEYIPVYIDKLLEREKTRAESGHFLTEAALDSTLGEIDLIRKSGKRSYLYTFLGKRMDLLRMSKEEQAPYLERNEKAVDGVIAAYDKLYTELDALRASCEDARTPYQNRENINTDERYRYYLSKIAEITGAADETAAQKVFLWYDAALSYLEKEFSEMTFPQNIGEQISMFAPRQAENTYRETIAFLEKEYVPLTEQPNVMYFPVLYTPYLGSARLLYCYDRPDQSAIYFDPSADTVSIAVRIVSCNSYFFRYFAQDPSISRAQLSAAPDSYFAGLGFYQTLALAKDEAERTGNYAEYYLQFVNVYNSMLTGYTAHLIETGYTEDEIKNDLKTTFGLSDEMIENIFSYARSDPETIVALTLGYAQLIVLREACRVKLRGRMNDRQFLKAYLSFGPSFYNLLEEKMEAWCDSMLSA